MGTASAGKLVVDICDDMWPAMCCNLEVGVEEEDVVEEEEEVDEEVVRFPAAMFIFRAIPNFGLPSRYNHKNTQHKFVSEPLLFFSYF